MTDVALPLTSTWDGSRLARWLGWSYALLIAAGVLVFQLPGAMVRGNEMSFERSVFTVVNAATLTGFQQAVPIDDYGASGKACVITLTVAGTLLTLIIGGMALNRALRLGHSDAQIVWATCFTFVFCVGIGTAMLLEPTRQLLDSAFQATSALGNSGLYTGRLPGGMDWRTHAALLPLMVLGGLGVPVLMELTDCVFRRKPMSKHSQVVLTLSAGVYLLGLLLLTRWSMHFSDLPRAMASGSALSVDARTTGLPIVSMTSVTRVAQWLLIVFMSIGAAPAGTAGGFKVTALYHAWRGTTRALHGERGSRVSGIAATWIICYVLMFFVTLLALLGTLTEMAADRLVFLAASALSNCGLSPEPVVLTGGGLWTIVLAMLAGRAAPLFVLWWLAETTDDADVAV